MALAISTTLHSTFDDAVEDARKALADHGFGVPTEIDVKATLKATFGEELEDCLISGACNPSLAHRAIDVDRRIGVLLPCNVVVRTDPAAKGMVIVDAMDPQVMAQVADEPELAPWPTKPQSCCARQSNRSHRPARTSGPTVCCAWIRESAAHIWSMVRDARGVDSADAARRVSAAARGDRAGQGIRLRAGENRSS